MKKFRITAAALMALSLVTSFTACSSDDGVDIPDMPEEQTTTAVTVEINTATMAVEQQEQVEELADTLTGELENKTVKWLSFYDPWHATTQGNTKPVSMELFEQKYGGEIEYYQTTWANQYSDLSTFILGGEGIDFFPAAEAVPKCMISGMTQPYDPYIDWNDPLWESVADVNDSFKLGKDHYLSVCQTAPGYVVFYNRQTIEENGLEDPRELYENGEWTLTKFKEMLMDFVDEGSEHYGLDGWFNCTPLYLASGTPSISIKDGKVQNNLMSADFERAMLYQADLNKFGLIVDKSLFDWNPRINYIGEGKELFYIGGLYEIESDPEIWTKTFGAPEDVFFVPVPRDEQADAYYYNAEFECYNLCKGAQNPEGFARLMECVIASVYDENAIQINNDKHKMDFGWTDEMIEMRDEVSRLTKENPVRDVYGGMPTDVSGLINDAFNSPIQGGDWFEQRDSINELVDLSVQEVNDFIVSASN